MAYIFYSIFNNGLHAFKFHYVLETIELELISMEDHDLILGGTIIEGNGSLDCEHT